MSINASDKLTEPSLMQSWSLSGIQLPPHILCVLGQSESTTKKDKSYWIAKYKNLNIPKHSSRVQSLVIFDGPSQLGPL